MSDVEQARAAKSSFVLDRARRNRLVAFFVVGVGLLFLFAAASAALFVNRANNRANELVARTVTVLIEARSYQAGVQGAVIGERAYLLTGEERFLTDYEHALDVYRTSQERVRELTRDSPTQQLRLDRLDAIADEIAALLRRAIVELQPEEVVEYVRSNNVDPMLAQFNQQIEEFINEESRRLRDQRMKQIQSGRLGDKIILFALVTIAGLLFLQVYITQEQNKLQSARNAQMMVLTVELEQRVDERTKELQQAKQALEEENRRVESLLRDLHHRVGNSLQLVASFLGLQASQVENEEARASLRAARERVLAIAATQRRLRFSSDHETVDAKEFINLIVEDLKANLTFEQEIEIETDIDDVTLPSRDAVTIGVLIAELVTNAVKYAFRGHDRGRIGVALKDDAKPGYYRLSIEDDGVGVKAAETDPHGGLGMRIIGQLVDALDGKYESAASGAGGERPGTRATVVFPHPPSAA